MQNKLFQKIIENTKIKFISNFLLSLVQMYKKVRVKS
jgi:hypothetical protein